MSSETDRSRSLRDITNAMQVRAEAVQSPPSISESQSQSTPETRVGLPKAKASPETLSRFLAGSQAGSPGVPLNPFHGPAAEGSIAPGPTFVSQTVNQVQNEFHVSMDPFIIAQASEAIEQSRQSLRSEALRYVEAERELNRAEAMQFAEHVQSEAARVVGEA